MATTQQIDKVEDRIFSLQPYGGRTSNYIIITPTDMPLVKVQAAWAYALRYTAQGLDLPDHEAAIRMLQQRHPSWTLLESRVQAVAVNLALADQDEPEPRQP